MTDQSEGAMTARAAALHARIRADIEKQILSGALKPGDRIPFEHELTAAYGCSRMTANKAVTDLVRRGLVVRRRRAGSFVAPPPLHSTVLDIPDIQAEVTRRGQVYSYTLIACSVREASASDPAERALAGGGRLLALECLHGADGRPLALERRLIGLSAVPAAETADFVATPPGGWLLEHVPWTQAEHRIFAVGADAAASRLLAVEADAPCLLLERKTWRDGTPVTHVWQTFPGDRYHLVGAFVPARG